jgi:hypothetical protein
MPRAVNREHYRLVSDRISRIISPASQIFYPGAVFTFFVFETMARRL